MNFLTASWFDVQMPTFFDDVYWLAPVTKNYQFGALVHGIGRKNGEFVGFLTSLLKIKPAYSPLGASADASTSNMNFSDSSNRSVSMNAQMHHDLWSGGWESLSGSSVRILDVIFCIGYTCMSDTSV